MNIKKGLIFVVLLILVSSFVSAGIFSPVIDPVVKFLGFDKPKVPDQQMGLPQQQVGGIVPNIEDRLTNIDNALTASKRFVMALSSQTNAHGATVGSGAYGYGVFLPSNTKLYDNSNTCTINNKILYLSGESNAHASKTQSGAYNVPICHKAVSACESNVGGCPVGKDAIVWLNAETNAHLSLTQSAVFNTAVCCTVEKSGDVVVEANLKNINEPCTNNDECITGLCYRDFLAGTRYCSLYGPGVVCTDDKQCVSGNCVYSFPDELKCAPGLAGNGKSCRDGNDCIQGLTCIEHICKIPGGDVPNGGACPNDNDALCASGNCVENVCKPSEEGGQCQNSEECIARANGDTRYVCNDNNVCGRVIDSGRADSDDDRDGVLRSSDNCPVNYNPGQEDRDGDGIGDVCDPHPDEADTDGMITCKDLGGVYCGSRDCINSEKKDTDERRSGKCCVPNEGVNSNLLCSDQFFDPTLGQMVDRVTSDCIDDNGDGIGIRKVTIDGQSQPDEPCTTIPSNQLNNGQVPFMGLIGLFLMVVILGLFYGFKLNRKI